MLAGVLGVLAATLRAAFTPVILAFDDNTSAVGGINASTYTPPGPPHSDGFAGYEYNGTQANWQIEFTALTNDSATSPQVARIKSLVAGLGSYLWEWSVFRGNADPTNLIFGTAFFVPDTTIGSFTGADYLWMGLVRVSSTDVTPVIVIRDSGGTNHIKQSGANITHAQNTQVFYQSEIAGNVCTLYMSLTGVPGSFSPVVTYTLSGPESAAQRVTGKDRVGFYGECNNSSGRAFYAGWTLTQTG